jgi:hypothetical protein
MSDGEKPAPRGEAAWLAAREKVAKRNAETRKAGKIEREDVERRQQEARRSAEARRAAELAQRTRRA